VSTHPIGTLLGHGSDGSSSSGFWIRWALADDSGVLFAAYAHNSFDWCRFTIVVPDPARPNSWASLSSGEHQDWQLGAYSIRGVPVWSIVYQREQATGHLPVTRLDADVDTAREAAAMRQLITEILDEATEALARPALLRVLASLSPDPEH
jgi:hypothetical protein